MLAFAKPLKAHSKKKEVAYTDHKTHSFQQSSSCEALPVQGMSAKKFDFAKMPQHLPGSICHSVTSPIQRSLRKPRNSIGFEKKTSLQNPLHIHRIASQGVQGPGQPLPYFDKIQRAFGPHDLSKVRAYTGSQASVASRAINAEAYATGNRIAFAQRNPSLHTVAHEATHIVQQRAGVHLKSGMGEAGDKYEQQADAVADQIVQGKSVSSLLGQLNERQIQNLSGNLQRQVIIKTEPKPNVPNLPPDYDHRRNSFEKAAKLFENSHDDELDFFRNSNSIDFVISGEHGLGKLADFYGNTNYNLFNENVKEIYRIGDKTKTNAKKVLGLASGAKKAIQLEIKKNNQYKIEILISINILNYDSEESNLATILHEYYVHAKSFIDEIIKDRINFNASANQIVNTDALYDRIYNEENSIIDDEHRKYITGVISEKFKSGYSKIYNYITNNVVVNDTDKFLNDLIEEVIKDRITHLKQERHLGIKDFEERKIRKSEAKQEDVKEYAKRLASNTNVTPLSNAENINNNNNNNNSSTTTVVTNNNSSLSNSINNNNATFSGINNQSGIPDALDMSTTTQLPVINTNNSSTTTILTNNNLNLANLFNNNNAILSDVNNRSDIPNAMDTSTTTQLPVVNNNNNTGLWGTVITTIQGLVTAILNPFVGLIPNRTNTRKRKVEEDQTNDYLKKKK